ncbi:MAG: peptidylprolyl isomerase [Pyrinomonadaceae bacterium]|nr:peptidylprolyl isomerase [Phycisphaerales bacterium]
MALLSGRHRHNRSNAPRSAHQTILRCEFVEELEARTLFGASPFPSLADMDNPNNTVVRMSTSYGDIDIELFDSLTPITVTNFLNYVRDGDYDQSFFHRLASDFVLQGGGFRYDALPGAASPTLTAVPADGQIMNEYPNAGENVARTISMAKLAAPPQGPPNGGPNSATNQWFFNLIDNTNTLNQNQNGGFTVFGEVLDEASWNVILTITGLSVRNLVDAPSGGALDYRTAPFSSSIFSTNFETVPLTTTGVPAENPPEDTVVRLHDVEIIKARNVQTFYTNTFYYPEGFAGSTINEFLPIGNTTNAEVFYQVIVRAEVITGDISTPQGWFRDRVISTGSIAAHTRGGITISHFGPGGAPSIDDLVPQGVPYSIEIRATGELAPTLSHYDFGTSTGEAFTTTLNTTWGFAQAEKNNGSVNDFLVWSNPNDVNANIQLTLYFQASSPIVLNVTTDSFRRGGFAFSNLAQIPNNTSFSVRMVSDVPIVAALSHYNSTGDQSGSTSLGIPGTGLAVGVLPGGIGGPGLNQTITFLNPSESVTALIKIVLRFENPAQEVTAVSLLAITSRSRAQFNLATLNNPRVQAGEAFSVLYSPITNMPTGLPLYAHSSLTAQGDVASTALAVRAATTWSFGEGFMDPARAGVNVFENISLYNPNSTFFTGGANVTANVTINYIYNDGFVLSQSATVTGGGRFQVNIEDYQPVLDRGTINNRFFYSIQVISDVPIIAQMFHYDLTLGGAQPSGGFTTLGTPGGTIVALDQL